MPTSFKRALLLGSSAIIGWSSLPTLAHAQTQLPAVEVTAPSPIVRRKPAVRHPQGHTHVTRTAPNRTQVPVEAEPVAASAPPQGVLPVVTDQFATVTVVPNDEIRRSGATTLGDLVANKPGISASGYAPGASSRPIIRGLDVNRVGIVENGMSSGGASDLGEDHFVPVDPFAANQVEVIRGPATLRYGSQSIGGVVSASNNRIPDALPNCAVAAPFQSYGLAAKAPAAGLAAPGCMNAEVRTSINSATRGVDGGILLDAGGGNVAVHADVYGNKAGDYNVPSYPYAEPGIAFNGRQSNTAMQSGGASVGGSYFFDGGYIGAAITHNRANYGIPGIEGAEQQTRIVGEQTKVTMKGEYRPDAAAIEAIRFWAGATNYKHDEIGLEEGGTGAPHVHQTFTNKEQEGRVEVQMMPFNAGFAAVTTAFGIQASHQELTAPSPEDVGSPLNGLFDPNRNTKVAGYVFNELKFTDWTRAQIAGRIEHVSLTGTTPSFVPELFDLDADPAAIGAAVGRNLSFTPKSGSIGLIQDLPWGGLSASITAQYTERAPKPAELFSRGGHDATGTFDIGNPNLGIETAKSIELGLRRATGPVRFELTGYYTQFNGFIYRALTGNTCSGSACIVGAGEELNQAIYSQRDATFRGGEFQTQIDVAQLWSGTFGIEGQADVVRATFADGTNVPRIPPVRAGGGVFWRDSNWFVRINMLHAFAQNDVAPVAETPTAGYNLLKAELSYKTLLDPRIYGAKEMTVGVVGNNLLNENIRYATSYNKDNVLQPGLNVRAFASVKF
ncbi:MAG: TonB-dependent receptor [Bradyrhizobiaceae bacterium PARB1]|nr:MAG: TonB-dependent receptor [Bradyrhizobiaceae bacterium PARB1]